MAGETSGHGSYPGNSIFETAAWLDAVAPGRWGRIEVHSDSGALMASLPVVQHRIAGMPVVDMPPLTPYSGLWLAPPPTGQNTSAQMGYYMDVIGRLVDKIPHAALTRIRLNHSVPTVLPFLHRGFEAHLRYTHVLPDLTSLDDVWASYSKNRRKKIRSLSKRMEVVQTEDLDLFLRLVGLTFSRQGLSVPYDRSIVERLDQSLKRIDSRRILLCCDDQGRPHAAEYVVFDEHATYSLMRGADPGLRNSNAGDFLTWEAIRFASTRSAAFDFSGMSMPQLEPNARGFGARQVPYVQLVRASLGFRAAVLARESMAAAQEGLMGLRGSLAARLPPKTGIG